MIRAGRGEPIGQAVSETRIRKAVFPVAGFGGAFQPATKVVSKEMLPILDKPLIQYAVEEAAAAGCETFIFVERPEQGLLSRHFRRDAALESRLEEMGRPEAAAAARDAALPDGSIVSIIQERPLGLGHAVLCAREAVGDEPFAVLLPDDVILGEPSVLEQMVAAYPAYGGALIAGIEVRRTQVASYGVMSIEDTGGDVVAVTALEEKPEADVTSSNFSVTGRYLLPPAIFAALEDTKPDAQGAVQLTDGIARLIGGAPVHGLRYRGERFDCGGVSGYVRATLAMAARRAGLGEETRAYMRRILERDERGPPGAA